MGGIGNKRMGTIMGTPRPCFNCGEAHWVQDCSYSKRVRPSQLLRYCEDCGIKPLVLDCQINPLSVNKINVNMIGVVASPSQSLEDGESVIPLKVITRAQAKKLPEPSLLGGDKAVTK